MPPRRSWLRRIGLLLCIALALVGVAAIVERLGAGAPGMGVALGSCVGVVELEGEIRDAEQIVESLTTLRKDPSVVAVVVRIDSPGGGVAPSQEIYEEIVRLRETKPVIASLGNVAASGGYYVAAATSLIVAAPGTLTGSIGVIMEFRQFRGLADKVGVSQEIVKSGPFKDAGNPLRSLTDTERSLLQGMVDDVYAQFVEAVASGRGLDPAQVRRLADGRLYSGQQAKAAGLVDELGGLATAVRIAWEKGGQTGEPRIRRVRGAWRPWWLDALGESLTPVRPGLGGGLLFLYGGPTPQ
jgi:protease-4